MKKLSALLMVLCLAGFMVSSMVGCGGSDDAAADAEVDAPESGHDADEEDSGDHDAEEGEGT